MRHENTKALHAYWDMLRRGRKAPERGEVEPGEIRDILGDTFILEVSTQMRAISFRLAGTRLCAAHGRELKGLGYLALWSEEDNFDVAKAVHRVYCDYTPVLLSYTAQTQDGRFIEYEAILLPLMPGADGNARILGIASPRKTPYWLGAEPLVINHLRTARVIDMQPAPAMFQETGKADAADPAEGVRKVRHLTVLDGGLS